MTVVTRTYLNWRVGMQLFADASATELWVD